VLYTQAIGVAVSGSYAYVAGRDSDSLVVIEISNPASPVIRGSVVSSSLLDGVREARSRLRGWRRAPRLRPHRTVHRTRIRVASAADALSPVCCHVLCAQAQAVAVSGSYAYVTAEISDSLVVIDISNPASPVIRGSVVASLLDGTRGVAVSGLYAYVTGINSNSLVVIDVSNPASPVIRGSVVSSLMNMVCEAGSCTRGWPRAPACVRSAHHACVRGASSADARRAPRSRSHVLCTADWRRRERLIRLRDGS
jgi:hypothetical protein